MTTYSEAAPRQRFREKFSLSSPSKLVSALFANATLIIIGLLFVIPLVWVLLAAFNSSASLSISWPRPWSLQNFKDVTTYDQTWRPMWNGLLISGVGAVVVSICACLAAYPLSRYKMRFKNGFLYTVLFASALPITAIMVPVYEMFVRFGIIDAFPALILFMSATSLPYAIWMTKNFMDSVPIELEEAAWVDGASAMKAMMRVVLPLMVPGLIAVFVFQFISFWGNFFAPFILLSTDTKLPMAVTLYNFFGDHGVIIYGQLAAYSIIYTVPVIVLYVFISKGLSGAFRLQGGVKG